jgi:hypothetical protein
MPALRTTALGLLLAAVTTGTQSCEQTGDATTPVVDGPYLEMAYTCDEHGGLIWVEPDTPQTREQAVVKCGRLDRELDALPWPDGINP